MRKTLSMVLAIVFLLSSAVSAEYLIDDCDDGDAKNAQGGSWYTLDDSDAKGTSKVTPKPGKFKMTKSEDGYAAGMKGKLGSNLSWDGNNVVLGCTLTKKSGCPGSNPVDLSKYNYITFRMKGSIGDGLLEIIFPYTTNGKCSKDGKPITLTDNADWAAAITPDVIDEWVEMELELREDFIQMFWGSKKVSVEDVLKNMHEIKFRYRSESVGSIDLLIDDIKFIE